MRLAALIGKWVTVDRGRRERQRTFKLLFKLLVTLSTASQEDKRCTSRSSREIERETAISRSSVRHTAKKDLGFAAEKGS